MVMILEQNSCHGGPPSIDNSEGRQLSDLMALDDLQTEGNDTNSNTYDYLDKCINDTGGPTITGVLL